MKISRTNINRVISIYSKRDIMKTNNKHDINNKKDSIEISKIGKKLSTLTSDEDNLVRNKKIDKIKTEIEKGTYKIDSKVLAKKMIDIMKGRDV